MPEYSTKPYLLRAIYEWCTDNGFTPYLAVAVDSGTRVPKEFVKNGEIVLNISFSATSGLKMDNDFIMFHARFGGVSREIVVPVENVMAIYARENGQGMAFEADKTSASESDPSLEADAEHRPRGAEDQTPSLTAVPGSEKNASESTPFDEPPEPPKKGARPTLTRIK
jgi:stringent starvation protein B